jgi:hypothetical protein
VLLLMSSYLVPPPISPISLEGIIRTLLRSLIFCPGGGGDTHSPGGEGSGGSIFWKPRDIGLPSYSNNLSTILPIG